MATIKARGFNNPKSMRVDGTGANVYDQAVLPAIADVGEFLIPAGLELINLDVRSTAGTMTFSAGVRPVRSDSLIATNATFFAAAGQAFTNNRREIPVAAVKFNEDVVLTITTAVAAGTVDVVLQGNAVGAA